MGTNIFTLTCFTVPKYIIGLLIYILPFFPEDTVVHEFSALGLSQLAIEFTSKAVIFESNGIEPLVKCLSSTDPDVQKNSIETLAQLLLVMERAYVYFSLHTLNYS